jgi:hypothetical protein
LGAINLVACELIPFSIMLLLVSFNDLYLVREYVCGQEIKKKKMNKIVCLRTITP